MKTDRKEIITIIKIIIAYLKGTFHKSNCCYVTLLGQKDNHYLFTNDWVLVVPQPQINW